MTKPALYKKVTRRKPIGTLVKNAVLVGTTALLTLSFSLPSSPIGFASQSGGTTGGKGGTEHTVSTGDELQALLKKGASKMIIYVNGTITTSNTTKEKKINVKEVSDISIIGKDTKGIFEGIGIKIVKANNIIIQNLIIHHVNIGDKDCISIEGPVDHVWVDHCELYNDLDHGKDYYDGLLDAKRQSEYITVSRCYFHHSYKTTLVGSGSDDTYDRKMTYCFNYFLNCNSRQPSYRGGTGHIFNNVYISTKEGIGSTGINSRIGAKLRIEGNYFQNIGNGELDDSGKGPGLEEGPIGAYYDAPGGWDVKDNIFASCLGNQPTTSTTSYSPPYSYNAVSASLVRKNVWNDVGAQGSKIERVEGNLAGIRHSPKAGSVFSFSKNQIKVNAPEAGLMNVQMFSMTGQSISSSFSSIDQGQNLIPIKTPKVGGLKGPYILQYTLNKHKGVHSLIMGK